MARLNTIGFELNSTTSAMEFGTAGGTIGTGTVRTGTYAGRINALGSGTAKGFIYQFASANSNGPYFFRVYMWFTTLPTAENRIISVVSGTSTAASSDANITIDNTGALRLYYNNATVNTVIGSPSAALATKRWYCIEMKFDRSLAGGSQVVEAKLEQTVFATTSAVTINAGIQSLIVGGNLASEAQTVADWFTDDWAINDATGSFQNTYAGQGKVSVYLRPSAAGDNNAFTTQTGGTAGAANNFTRVNEITPNDVTSFNGDTSLNTTDDFNLDDSPTSIGPNDTINCVQVGVRFRGSGASANSAFVVRVKKAASGTVSEGSVITPPSTTFFSNASAVPRSPTLTLYNDPDGNPWTKATLDTAQLGYRIQAASTNRADISAIWMIVDSTPAPVTAISDAFTGTVIDATKWVQFTAASGILAQNNTLNETPANTTSGSWAGVYSLYQYDLTGKNIFVQQPAAGLGNTFLDLTLSAEILPSNNFISIGVNTGTGNLEAGDEINGTFTTRATVTYNAATMQWLQLRESAGTVFFEYSGTGKPGSWTTLDSRAPAIPITNVYVVLDDFEYNALGSPGTASIDNLNIPPAFGGTMLLMGV